MTRPKPLNPIRYENLSVSCQIERHGLTGNITSETLGFSLGGVELLSFSISHARTVVDVVHIEPVMVKFQCTPTFFADMVATASDRPVPVWFSMGIFSPRDFGQGFSPRMLRTLLVRRGFTDMRFRSPLPASSEFPGTYLRAGKDFIDSISIPKGT